MAAGGLTATNETLQRLGENLVFFIFKAKEMFSMEFLKSRGFLIVAVT